MQRMFETIVYIGAAAALCVAGCDSEGESATASGSGETGPESCRKIVKHMKKISDEAPDNPKMKNIVDMTTQACKETNSLEKHSEVLACVEEATSQKEMDNCEGFAEMENEWQESIKGQMTDQIKEKMKEEMGNN